MSLPCVLRLPLFWPSLGFLTTFLFFPPCASVESQFLRDGVLPPGRVSSVGVFVHSFPWFTSCPLLLVSFSAAPIPPSFSQCVGYYLLRRGFPCGFYTSLSCRLAFPSTLILFLFLFLRLSLSSLGFPSSSFPIVISSVLFPSCCCSPFCFYLIYYVLIPLLGRDSGKFSRLPPQVFSFSSSSPLRPLRLASSSIPAGPLCPGHTIACPLLYRLLYLCRSCGDGSGPLTPI